MRFLRISTLISGVFLIAIACQIVVAVEFANINVVEHNTGNATTSVTVTTNGATPGFTIRSGSNRGDYNVQIGASAADDVAGGVLISSIAQNLVDHGNGQGQQIGTSSIDGLGGFGPGYFIALGQASSGSEYNSNVSAAYFDFAEGWVAGYATNSTNGGAITTLNSSAGINLGTEFIDNGTGTFGLTVPNHDSRADGILLASHGKNEANHALVNANGDGSFTMRIQDNSTSSASSTEQDPVSFAYIPLGTAGVTMGTVIGEDGINGPGVTVNQGDFTIRNTATGTYQLEIVGESSATGTLLVTPQGGGGNNVDNIVTFEANGTGWEIQSRDLPGASLQGLGGTEAFSFAFLPFATPPTAPGTDPSAPFDPNNVAAGNVVVTEFTPNNTQGDNFARVDVGSRGLGIANSNRGDNQLSLGGEKIAGTDGVLLGTISQNSRDNSATGGLSDTGATISPYLSGGTYIVATATDADANAEHNVNFNAVYFPNAAGFTTDANVATAGGNDTLNLASVDSRSDGILIANAFGNTDNYVTTGINAAGGWDIQVRDNSDDLEGGAYTYAFVPFGTENLVAAGRIGDGGEVEARQGEFTVVQESTGMYRLSINGHSAQTGSLLLTPTHDGNSSENIVTFEADGNDFIVQGLDTGGSGFNAQATGFGFVFVPYDTPLANPQLRVFDDTALQTLTMDITQNDTGNGSSSVSVSDNGGNFFSIGNAGRGDFVPYVNGVPFDPSQGILLATVAENGRDNGDGFGTVYGIANVEHRNLTGTDGFVAVDRIGTNAETNINVAMAYFPFSGGYIGAHANADGTLLTPNSLPAGSTLSLTGSGTYEFNLSGINSETDGALFVINGSNADNAWATQVNAGGNGWTLASYDNAAGSPTSRQNEDFSSLYLPFEVNDNVAAIGLVNADGTIEESAGTFTLTKQGIGEYLLDVEYDVTEDPVLLLSLAELNNNALSYEMIGDDFLIQSRDLGSGLLAPLEDAAFSFALLASGGMVAAAVPEPASIVIWSTLAIIITGLGIASRGKAKRSTRQSS